MSQIVKKGIANDAVGGTKIRLENATFLRARNFANSADVNLLDLNASDELLFGTMLSRLQNSIVLPTATALKSRNAANSADLNLFSLNASDEILGGAQTLRLQAAAVLPNVTALKGRNAANSSDLNLFQLNASDEILVGAQTLRLQAAAVLPNATFLKSRNAANSADVNVLELNASNKAQAGVDFDFGAFRAFNMYLEPIQLASDPTGVTGQVYYNTTTNLLKFYNGTVWAAISSGGSGANTALSNLASTAVNASIIPGADNSIDLGSATFLWRNLYLGTYIKDTADFAVLDAAGRRLNDAAGSEVAGWDTTTGGANNKGVLGIFKEIEFTDFTISNFYIRTANNPSGTSQGIIVESGFGTGGGSGDIYLRSGSGDSSASGSMNINTGDGGAVDIASGACFITTGNVTGTAASGDISLLTGSSVDGTTGNVTISIPDPTGTGVRGQFLIQDGSEGTAGYVWTSTDVNGRGAWASPAAAKTWGKVKVTLSGTDITNQYYDLTEVAVNNSVSAFVKGQPMGIEDAAEDYSLSYTGGAGGKTRITFGTNWATGGGSALVAGDVLVVQFQY